MMWPRIWCLLERSTVLWLERALSLWQTTQVLRPRNSHEKLRSYVMHSRTSFVSFEKLVPSWSQLYSVQVSRTSFLDGELGSSVMGFRKFFSALAKSVELSQVMLSNGCGSKCISISIRCPPYGFLPLQPGRCLGAARCVICVVMSC